MRCPFCNASDTKVVDSRLANEGDSVRRRRECLSCSERYTTFENAELSYPRVVKGDNLREPFCLDKLRGGIMRALEKRPVNTENIENSINRIKHKLRCCGEREVKTSTIGKWVMQELRVLDDIAYVRFASVYQRFEDVREFRDQIEKMENELSPEQKKRQFTLLPSDSESS